MLKQISLSLDFPLDLCKIIDEYRYLPRIFYQDEKTKKVYDLSYKKELSYVTRKPTEYSSVFKGNILHEKENKDVMITVVTIREKEIIRNEVDFFSLEEQKSLCRRVLYNMIPYSQFFGVKDGFFYIFDGIMFYHCYGKCNFGKCLHGTRINQVYYNNKTFPFESFINFFNSKNLIYCPVSDEFIYTHNSVIHRFSLRHEGEKWRFNIKHDYSFENTKVHLNKIFNKTHKLISVNGVLFVIGETNFLFSEKTKEWVRIANMKNPLDNIDKFSLCLHENKILVVSKRAEKCEWFDTETNKWSISPFTNKECHGTFISF